MNGTMDAIMNLTMGNQTLLFLNSKNLSNALAEAMRKKYLYHCQYDPLPSAMDIVKSMNAGYAAFHIFLIILATIVVGLFIEEVFFLKANMKLSARRRLTVLQAGIPPTFAVASVVGSFFPSGTVMIDFVCSVYFGIGLHAFLVLMVNYYGGLRQMLLRFNKKSCVIHTGPFCCCCFCLPSFKMTKKNFTILWYATFQAAFTRPIVLFFEGVVQGDHSIPIPGLIYTACLICSMLTGMWALVIFRRASGDFLGRYRVTGKFFNFQMVLLIANVQPFVIKLTYKHCVLPYTALASKLVINYQIMVIEFFLLAVITRFLYRRESDNDELEKIIKTDLNENKDQSLELDAVEKLIASENGMNGNSAIVKSSLDNRLDDYVV